MTAPVLSRRHFLQGLLGSLAASQLAAFGAPAPSAPVGAFRFAFLTDLHLMKGGALRSAEGIAMCLQAVEKLDPRPDFILVGGDTVHDAPSMTIADATREFDLFFKTWHDNTSRPAYWTMGNHDLTATNLPNRPMTDPGFAKGLYGQRTGLSKLFYSFDIKGWHFVIMDDIALQPDWNYEGRLVDDELAFLKADLQAHAATPTILCTHIPLISAMPFAASLAQAAGFKVKAPKDAVCTNATALTDDFPGHNIRAVLAGHLHHYEQNDLGGVPFYNSGAVCGNWWKGSTVAGDWWKGPLKECPEGFAVVDLGADGSVKFDYRTYGWKA